MGRRRGTSRSTAPGACWRCQVSASFTSSQTKTSNLSAGANLVDWGSPGSRAYLGIPSYRELENLHHTAWLEQPDFSSIDNRSRQFRSDGHSCRKVNLDVVRAFAQFTEPGVQNKHESRSHLALSGKGAASESPLP